MTNLRIHPGSLTGDPMPPGEEVAVSFFRSGLVGEALASKRFTVNEEFGILVDLMRSADEKVQLAAQGAFRRTLRDVAEADGIIGKQTLTVRGKGGSVSVSRSVLPKALPDAPTHADLAAINLSAAPVSSASKAALPRTDPRGPGRGPPDGDA